ncbi:MAG: molybdopterin-dependent oxidoreductase [Thermoanaerobaculales bacterium]
MSPKTTFSACYMCTANCPITVVSDADEILSIDHPPCVRAEAMLEQRESPQRVTTPRLRQTAAEPWRDVSWDEALALAAHRLLAVRDRHGPEPVVFAVGYTKEVRPYLRRLAQSFGSPHYVTESSCCFSSGFVAARVTLGSEYEYFLTPGRRRYSETKCRLVWSNNPAESQLPYDRHHLLADAAEVPTIAVDPRRTTLTEAASIHLQLRPGTDGALALGLAHVIFEEGLQDQGFLDEFAHGLDAYRRYIKEFTPGKTSDVTGIPGEKIIAAARLYATSDPAQITISPNATTHHSNGFQAHRAVLLLAAICGNLDVEASFDERLEGSGLRFEDLPKDGSHRMVGSSPPRERKYLENGFGTPTGKIEFVSTALALAGHNGLPIFDEPSWSPVSAPDIAKDFPLVLTSGGRSRNYTHSQGRMLTVLRDREPTPSLQIHPEDARTRGIQEGLWVEVSSPLGTIEMQARVTDALSPGVVHAVHGWAGHNINELIPRDCLDPISGFPPFKSSLCQVRRTENPSAPIEAQNRRAHMPVGGDGA